jgi:urease alpha subunit
MPSISRNEYVGLFGATTGDRIRLGNTGLFVEIERDLRGAYGDEGLEAGEIDGDSGVGTQFWTGPIDADARTDIAVANNQGVFVFLRR